MRIYECVCWFFSLQKTESPVRKDIGQTYISVDVRSLDSFGIPKGFPLFAPL